MMVVITYPEPVFSVREENNREIIFDPLRKKWVSLTPEEWVRQNFVQYLLQVKQYPATLVAVEKEIQLGELKKRFDVLVYDKAHQPWMMIECKASHVPLQEAVLQQLLRYTISVPVPFLVITNGPVVYAWQKTGGRLLELTELPVHGE